MKWKWNKIVLFHSYRYYQNVRVRLSHAIHFNYFRCWCVVRWRNSWLLLGVLKDVQQFYSIDNSQAGLLQSSFVVSYMIFCLLFGYLGDRFKRKWIMIAGVVLWSGITFASSFIGSQVRLDSTVIGWLTFTARYSAERIYALLVVCPSACDAGVRWSNSFDS